MPRYLSWDPAQKTVGHVLFDVDEPALRLAQRLGGVARALETQRPGLAALAVRVGRLALKAAIEIIDAGVTDITGAGAGAQPKCAERTDQIHNLVRFIETRPALRRARDDPEVFVCVEYQMVHGQYNVACMCALMAIFSQGRARRRVALLPPGGKNRMYCALGGHYRTVVARAAVTRSLHDVNKDHATANFLGLTEYLGINLEKRTKGFVGHIADAFNQAIVHHYYSG